MLTKKELCLAAIQKFESEEHVKATSENITMSSSLAIAMEHLGMLKGNDLEYAQSRGGVLFTYFDKNETKCLTFREVLDLLPN